jgi:murein DD-endopeptidase MepM/ murein hydrolase activator NlpD
MHHYPKVKTDYKHSRVKHSYYVSNIANRLKLPLACGFLAFAIIWRLSNWLIPVGSQQEEQGWVDDQQVTLSVILPSAEEEIAPPQPQQQPAPQTSLSTEDAAVPTLEWKTFTIKAGTNLAFYFQQAGLESKAVQEVLSIGHDAQHLKRIYPGQTIRIQANSDGILQTLQFDIDPLTTLVIERQDSGKLISQVEEKPIEKRVAFGGGKIFDSLFVAGKNAKLDDALILELANVFAYDIDFALDIKPNDYFKVLFEEYFVNGVKVGNGPIVAAEFVNNGKTFRAIRYTDQSGQASYYSPSGHSLKKAFIRTPVQYTRISSHFNLNRLHPVLHKIRAHKGVDYAAPHGTPVKAAGKGKVVFVGKKGGYGNAIILQHGSKYTTLYGHLSRFAKNLRSGAEVKQGQIIGYVGSTGLASGPHLHFEFRINGVHHNPLTVAMPQADGISHREKPKFLAYTNDLLKMMQESGKVVVAVNE